MREPMSADLALSNIIDIAKERCNAEGHECDWECSLLDRSIAVVTAPAAGMPHTPAPDADEIEGQHRTTVRGGNRTALFCDCGWAREAPAGLDAMTLLNRAHREHLSEMVAKGTRPAAQEPVSGPQSVPGQSDRGTGVSGPENPAQAADPGESIADYIGRTTAEQADALRPVHYREAAAKLRAIVAAQRPLTPDSHAHKHLDGIIAAAEHLESVARDEEKA